VASESANPPAAEAKTEPAEASGWDNAIFAPKRANVITSKPAAAEANAVKAGDLVEPGPDVIDPVLIKHPELKLPKEAKKKKIKDMVVRIRVLVDENGNVLEAKLDKAIGNGFDESAVKVARQARFIPATHGRVQVKMWTELPLHYRKN
jgi:TonB family protein